MLFHALDEKSQCPTIYTKKGIFEDFDKSSLTHSWAPSSRFRDCEVEYAQIWANGAKLKDVCPERHRAAYQIVEQRAQAYYRSFRTSKINLGDVCFYDLIPESFLMDYFNVKSDIAEFVFENYKKPENYEFMRSLCYFLADIRAQELVIDQKKVNYFIKTKRLGADKLKNSSNRIMYSPWGTVTGRLATEPGSFPILTMNKDMRSVLTPKNDCFVELDYNAAEVRVLFGLLGQQQPEEDIHGWISKNIFDGKIDREKTKKKVFSWLYNPNAKNKKLNEYIDRDKIYEKYYHDGCVITPYKRKIEVGREKALNYLIQSTASDMFLTSAMAIGDRLKDNKSFVSFCVHDSLVLDFSFEDRPILTELENLFSDTNFGNIKKNLSIGKDYGKMKRVT